MSQFLLEHNVPLAAADHLTDLVKKMFPDSSIAAKFASRRTKTTAIARTLGQEAKCELNLKAKILLYLGFSWSLLSLGRGNL